MVRSAHSGSDAPPNGPDVFVRYSEIYGYGFRSLEENQHVEFEVAQGHPRPRCLSHGRPGLPRDTARHGPGTLLVPGSRHVRRAGRAGRQEHVVTHKTPRNR
jgi:'Cold-shock' DNA-binding domain